MKTMLVPFGALVLLTACAAGSGDDSASTAQPQQPAKVTCVTHSHSMTSCTAVDPTENESYSCEDNVDTSNCVDATDDDYGGGCTFYRRYTRFAVDSDCDTYKAENPDLFK